MYRILVMIDDPADRTMAVNALSKCGYRVTTTECTTKEALRVDEYWTDLVLLDADLPGDSTSELLRTMRENPSSAAVPIVVVGGRDSTPELLMACAFGAADFLVKPLNPEVFRLRIARIIQVAMADLHTWVGQAAVGVAA
jgi:DNA-binding response OmpR family regulator